MDKNVSGNSQEAYEKVLEELIRQIWDQIGEAEQRQHILAAAAAWRMTGRSKKQKDRRDREIFAHLYACYERIWSISQRKENLEKFRQIRQAFGQETALERQEPAREDRVGGREFSRCGWLWEKHWERILSRFLRQVLTTEDPGDTGDRERMIGELEAVIRKLGWEYWRVRIRESVEAQIRETERKDALYRSWWREMLAQYRLRQ